METASVLRSLCLFLDVVQQKPSSGQKIEDVVFTNTCLQVSQAHKDPRVQKVFRVSQVPVRTQRRTASCSPDTARNSISQSALQAQYGCTAGSLCCSSTETIELTDRTWVITPLLLNDLYSEQCWAACLENAESRVTLHQNKVSPQRKVKS